MKSLNNYILLVSSDESNMKWKLPLVASIFPSWPFWLLNVLWLYSISSIIPSPQVLGKNTLFAGVITNDLTLFGSRNLTIFAC